MVQRRFRESKFVSHCGGRRLRDVAGVGLAAKRIPGRSAGDPMNSMPATSKAALTSSSVDERLGGTPSTASNRLIVLAVTPDLFANSSVVQRRAFRAERIWAPVIIDSRLIVTYSDNKVPEGELIGSDKAICSSIGVVS